MNKLVSLVFLFGIVTLCYSLDINLAEEGSCPNPPPKSIQYDPEYAIKNTSNIWYYHFVSKYYLYQMIAGVTGRSFEDIPDRILKHACLALSVGNFSFDVWNSFGTHQHFLVGPGKKDSYLWKRFGEKDWNTESWVTKADKDYFVTVNCFKKTNQKSVKVLALTKTLNNSLKSEIRSHIKSLGFADKYVYEVNVEQCPSYERYVLPPLIGTPLLHYFVKK